jgi:hypothetical protein
MKPFDLEAAKRGEPICQRDGRPVLFLMHAPNAKEGQRVIILNECTVEFRRTDGDCCNLCSVDGDLMMAPTKHEGWIVVMGEEANPSDADWVRGTSHLYASKQEAMNSHQGKHAVAVVKVEWEE